MNEVQEPSNQNISFSQMMRNPQRELAMDIMGITIDELQTEGISHQILAEVLFDFTMIEMEPDSPVTTETDMTWLSQLHRFRDRLQSQINDIEAIYKEPSN